MVNVSKKYLKNDLISSSWNGFIKEIKNARNQEEIKALFNKFFSSAEQIALEKRLAIIFLSKQGFSHREIGRILDVSPTTVGFVKRGFKDKEKIIRKENLKYVSAIRETKIGKSSSRFPTYKGRGRWRFLNSM